MKRMGVVVHAMKPEALASAARVTAALTAQGIDVVALPDDAPRISSVITAVPTLDDAELVLAFGGDGTLLRAAALVQGTAVPVMGVNLGHLGFLSAIEDADLDGALGALLSDPLEVEERALLTARVSDAELGESTVVALNDVIVEKQRVGRSIRLAIAIDGEPVVSWAADGVIVASSTGSTAYSFSVGGPVVSPRLACLIVTPVAPHGMFGRTMIAPPDEAITVTLDPASDPAALSADGATATQLTPGATVDVTLGETSVRLAHLDRVPFWRLLREKFRLPSEGP